MSESIPPPKSGPVLNIEPDELSGDLLVPADALHRSLGAKMVPFAGYQLPVQFAGVLAEHNHTRTAASLFDVSHMGQLSLRGPGAAAALERLVPSDIAGLQRGRQRYTLLTDEAGGIFDDLIVANYGDRLVIVANASRKAFDARHIAEGIKGADAELFEHPDRALFALQGPTAAAAMAPLCPEAAVLPFMGVCEAAVGGVPAWVSRSGYTGEDGFEISVLAGDAERLVTFLLNQPGVLPAGLGARDSLRLEAGLCLYGQDIDELTSPVEAGLAWTIGKRRRAEGGFLGAAAILDQLKVPPSRVRVGIRPDGPAPARALTAIAALDGTEAGTVTSGTFSPTLGAPIAMGYVRRDLAEPGTPLLLLVRGQRLPARVVPLPFVPHRYVKA